MTSTAVADSQATPQAEAPKRRFKLHVPTAFTILFILTVIAVAATWMVPAGSYSKLAFDSSSQMLQVTSPQGEVESLPATQEQLDKLNVKIGIEKFTGGSLKKPISIPGTYQRLDSTPQGIADITQSMVTGTIEAADIIVFILVLGGLIGVVNATGAFEAGLLALTKKTKGREFALVFMVSLLMVLGGTSCGLEEEAVAFYPILVPVFLALGYDSIICVGAIFLAGSMGTTFSTINPFSVVIASNAAGIVFTEGLAWRVFGCVVGAAVVIGYLWWYAKKIKANPAASYTWEDHEEFNAQWALKSTNEGFEFNWQKKLILILFVAAFPIMVWGVMSQGWWFPTMAASFLAITIIIMLLSLFGQSRLNGKALARGINYVMEQGKISDTLLYYSSNMVEGMSGPLFILAMLVIFFFLGFIVPSSSGLAVLSMPIFAPLADTVGIPRWIIVCAYQWGQYAMLFLAPTGLVMATLQMLDMKYSHWLKFVWPMVAFVLGFGGLMLVAQVLTA